MYLFGMIQNGPRGIHVSDEDVEDIQAYGIDWDDYDDDHILNHHDQANGSDNQGDNPFSAHTHRPAAEQMSRVDVVEPGCPLTAEQLLYLNSQLDSLPYINDGSMEMRRLVWVSALNICDYILTLD